MQKNKNIIFSLFMVSYIIGLWGGEYLDETTALSSFITLFFFYILMLPLRKDKHYFFDVLALPMIGVGYVSGFTFSGLNILTNVLIIFMNWSIINYVEEN